MVHKNTFFFVFVFIALTANRARAEKHVVGGSQGWEASTDFASWTSSKTFKVGDQLGMFLYLDLHKKYKGVLTIS